MHSSVIGRSAELRTIAGFLESADHLASALVIRGVPGIGKTTLWLAGVDQARDRGFHVLSARVGQAESVLAYSAVADLLREVDDEVLTDLPTIQQAALDRVLLRGNDTGPPTDSRAVAFACLSVVGALAVARPVLLAVDDAQWLDPSSRDALAFVSRRVAGRVGLLLTERTSAEPTTTSWLQLSRPDGVEVLAPRPLSLGGVHRLISERLGQVFPRPTLARIVEVSGGNPLYALELARAADRPTRPGLSLPSSLADLVRARVDALAADVQDVLLAASCVSLATVELLAAATSRSVDHTLDLLDAAEQDGVVVVDGNTVRFTHPLLAAGVYAHSSPARRRATHRMLAQVEAHPELYARHLALATASKDDATLDALDVAAEVAWARGAPAAAAELLDMAIGLGGDTPLRRVRAARHHLRCGNAERADALLDDATIERVPPGAARANALLTIANSRINTAGYAAATELLKRACEDAEDKPAMLVSVLLTLSFAQLHGGAFAEALATARRGVTTAEQLGEGGLLAQALALREMVGVMCGQGVSDANLCRALELEDDSIETPVALSVRANCALAMAWTGRVDVASVHLAAVRDGYLDRGADTEMLFYSIHNALIQGWRGNIAEAGLSAQDAVERAQQFGGDNMLSVALAARANVAALKGDEAAARADLGAAISVALRCGSLQGAAMPLQILAFLEASLGNYDAALAAVQPLLLGIDALPGTELPVAAFVPYAAEALILTGRADEAVPLIELLEVNGRRFDRAWMLVSAARCRAIWFGAKDDVEEAARTIERAMPDHDRLPIPFEKARALLLIGRLQRRQRRKESATAALTEALGIFESIGSALWAARTRAELDRTNVAPTDAVTLTPSEQRTAEFAATGLTNREIATKLFVSVKTVESNIGRVYRKLGIRSRAELGNRLGGSAAAGRCLDSGTARLVSEVNTSAIKDLND